MASQEIEELASALARLPGLGPRSARRAVLHLMKKRENALQPLLAALQTVSEKLSTCSTCGNVDTRFGTGILNGVPSFVEGGPAVVLDRMKDKVLREEAMGAAQMELAGPDVYDELTVLGRNDPPTPAADTVATAEDTILRILGDRR